MNLVSLVAKLGVKVLAIGASAHGGAKNRLDDEAVVGLEGGAVGVAEGVCEFLGRAAHVLAQGYAGEVETAVDGERGKVSAGIVYTLVSA